MKETIVLWCKEFKRKDVLDALDIIGHSVTEGTDMNIIRELNKLCSEDYENVQKLLGL